MTGKLKINFLYTEIGRGHPFYLDGIIDSLENDFGDRVDISVTNVFDVSRGLTLYLWKLLESLYRFGGQGGIIGKVYTSLRKRGRPNQYGTIEKILAKDIRTYLIQNRSPTVVAHPLLVPMISDLVPALYQHGEIAVPYQSAVKNCRAVFAPLQESKEEMARSGIPSDNIFVTGLCIERELSNHADELYRRRLIRLQNSEILIGGFFSSGAEPIMHVESIINAVISLDREGQKSIVFCRKGGRLESKLAGLASISFFNSRHKLDGIDEIFKEKRVIAVVYSNRSEEYEFTSRFFDYIDYFVAPSHERTNWAIGLGIPMFLLEPAIGPFSPLNCSFLIEQGVASKISSPADALRFSSMLLNAREDGSMVRMAQNGYGKYPINGFMNVARYIADHISKYPEQ